MTTTAKPKPTAAHSSSGGDSSKKELSPKSQFIGASLSMSWQLAVVVLVPIIGGYKLDQHFNSSPVWVIIGFLVAMAGFFMVIHRALKELNSTVYKDKK
jgi:F0F1-type ATP synthase assembly protein I